MYISLVSSERLQDHWSSGFVSPLAGSAFYHMTLFPLSDWLDDQVSALWDAGVCKKAKKPKNAVSVFCRFGIL